MTDPNEDYVKGEYPDAVAFKPEGSKEWTVAHGPQRSIVLHEGARTRWQAWLAVARDIEIAQEEEFTADTVNHLTDGEEEMQALRDAFTPDMVNHPPHYQSEKGVECIDAIEAAMTVEEFRGYLRGNCLKYLWRAEKKGREEDLKKAAWYLNKLIETPKP